MFRKKRGQSYKDLFAQKRKAPVYAVTVPGKRLRSLAPKWRWEKGWIRKIVPPIPTSFPSIGLRHLKVFWLCAILAILAFAFINRDSADQETVYILGMLVLTFPTGLLVPALFSLVIKHVYYLPGGFSLDLLLWPFFIAAGYAQWFIFPRWLVGRLRSRKG